MFVFHYQTRKLPDSEIKEEKNAVKRVHLIDESGNEKIFSNYKMDYYYTTMIIINNEERKTGKFIRVE